MSMAILIKTDGTEEEVKPKNGKDFKLKEIYKLVGNGCDMIQAIYLADYRTMFMDEESKIRPVQGASQTLNEKATKLLLAAGGIPWDVVLGNVLICSKEEVK